MDRRWYDEYRRAKHREEFRAIVGILFAVAFGVAVWVAGVFLIAFWS